MILIILLILLYINLISLLIYLASFKLVIRLKKKLFMSDNLYEIDSAMNMIKEDIIRELSECVSNQNKTRYYRQASSNNLSFSDKIMD